jgi:hypothetical protein
MFGGFGGIGMMGGIGGLFGSLLSLGNMFSSFGNMFKSNSKPHKLESNEARTALTGAKSSVPKAVPERSVMVRRKENSDPIQSSSVSQPTIVGSPKKSDNNSKNTNLKNMMAHFEESISRANFSINHYITSEQNPSYGLV